METSTLEAVRVEAQPSADLPGQPVTTAPGAQDEAGFWMPDSLANQDKPATLPRRLDLERRPENGCGKDSFSRKMAGL